MRLEDAHHLPLPELYFRHAMQRRPNLYQRQLFASLLEVVLQAAARLDEGAERIIRGIGTCAVPISAKASTQARELFVTDVEAGADAAAGAGLDGNEGLSGLVP